MNEFEEVTTRIAERARVRTLVLAMPPLTMGCANAPVRIAAYNDCCDMHRGIAHLRDEALGALTAYLGEPATVNAVLASGLGQDVALALAGSETMRAYIEAHYAGRPRDLGSAFDDVGPLGFEDPT